MNVKTLDKHDKQQVAKLFTSVFSASEGKNEGELIGKLAAQLASNIDNEEIISFAAYEDESIIGCIFFTRLHFNQPVRVYMLAPVAVATSHQNKGVGQALIRHGLGELQKRSVHVVVTYGDPSFYGKLRFEPLSEETIQAPLKLSMPEGWLGLSLTQEPMASINERPTCVEAFNDPAYW